MIGSDYYWDIVAGEVLRGDGPIAVHSKFGWLLSRPIHCDLNYVINNLALQVPCSVLTEGTKDELLDHLQCFWDTESLGITEPESGENEFQNIIQFDEVDCRYVVGLPWTSLELSSTNYTECLARLNLLRVRLLKDKFLLQEYTGTFVQHLQSGIIELVPEAQ